MFQAKVAEEIKTRLVLNNCYLKIVHDCLSNVSVLPFYCMHITSREPMNILSQCIIITH